MAFITRFNLVLIWSKIVQILTQKSSKWVPHIQVSWSSLIRPSFPKFVYKTKETLCILCLKMTVDVNKLLGIFPIVPLSPQGVRVFWMTYKNQAKWESFVVVYLCQPPNVYLKNCCGKCCKSSRFPALTIQTQEYFEGRAGVIKPKQLCIQSSPDYNRSVKYSVCVLKVLYMLLECSKNTSKS